MDRDQRDALARALGEIGSRRAVIGLLLAESLAALIDLTSANAKRKRKHRKKKKKCKRNCRGKQCGSDGCGGSCGKCGGDPECVWCRKGRCVPGNEGIPCGSPGSNLYCSFGICTDCGDGKPCCSVYGICGGDGSRCVDPLCSGAGTGWCGHPGFECCPWGSGCFDGVPCKSDGKCPFAIISHGAGAL
jgi:hypothetical protein